ncbi:carboxypeptidase-like regulatory domain-containing protein [Ignavibacterium album]|uniref:carboxypeptidase-like regulatory domain-containing protein n=1 Tax=Ignavibacterium album TaxID=591197 RepID=UPI0035BB1E97
MKRILSILFVVLSIGMTELFSQTISGVLTLNPYPSPYASDWENNPAALGSLSIYNNSGRSIDIRIRAIITMHGRGEIFRSITILLNIPSTPVTILSNTKLISLSDASFTDKDYEKKMRQTGRLLEGYYTACLILENSVGTVLASNICSNFTIVYPAAPQLIFPINSDSLENGINYPTFQWTPVIVPPAYQINYTLKIVEVLPGQIPSQAINSNIPLYENNQLQINSFTYPIDALPLQSGKKYAWQVQVLDQYGFPLTENRGKSEIFTFVKKKGSPYQFVQNPLTLIAPENDGLVKTNMPEFSWDFSPPSGVITKYNIRVVKILPNQTLEVAINNYPILNQTLLAKSYQPSQQLSLNATDNYAWQVIAFNLQTNDTLIKSEIRKFKLFNLLLLLPSNNSIVNNKRPTFQWAYYGANKKFYDLKIIKLPLFYYSPDGSISEDLFNDPQNVIYQQYNIDGAALSNVNSPELEIPVFKPDADLQMQEGKSYYWQVSVKEQPFGSITGKSEIRKITFNPYQPGFATNCSVTGKLNYEFAKPGEYLMWPLKNINIKFVVKYILKYNSYSGSGSYSGYTSPQGEIEIPKSSLNPVYHGDYDKTVAIGKTDNDGNFFFSFWNSKPMGVISENFTFSGGGGEFKYTYTGKLYRVIRLIVQSPYYTSPDQDIIVQPGENKSYPNIVSYVRSYSLSVKVKSPGTYWNNQFLTANAPIPNMMVYILRKNKPNEVPDNEGLPTPQDSTESPFNNSIQSGYKVIARQVTDVNGKANFERLVKSVYSQNDQYFIYVIADSNKTSLLYQSFIPISYKFKNQGDYAVYNNQYKYPTSSTEIVVFPLNPIVKGKIKRQDGGQPIQDAQVKLLDWAVFWWQKESTQSPNPQPTNTNGIFRFENLKNVFDNGGNTTGPVRGLKITKYGFRDTTVAVKSGVVLKPGESWSTEILLQPESKIIGKIVNEDGAGISAIVTVVGGESVESIPPFIFTMPGLKRAPASFSLQAPNGDVKVIFDPIPFDNSYLKDTIDISITGNFYDMGTIVIKRAMHRIKVFIGIESSSMFPIKLHGAKVKLETFNGNVLIGEKTSDQNGYAEFLFSNSTKYYKLTVSAPPNKDYQTQQKIIYNTETKDWKYFNIYLKPAAKISGYVYVGQQNQPVANVKVTIKGTDNGTFPVAYTDNKGYYILHNVPIGQNKFTASKKSSNLIGDESNLLDVPASGLDNVNFNLKIYSEMDITHLLGFPIEVNSLIEQNNEVIISGKFVDLDSLKNNIFGSTKSEMNFSNIAIEPDPNLTSVIFGNTVPVSKPKQLPLKTDENQLNIKVFDTYSGSINDNKIGIELLKAQTGYGVIKGKVKVVEGSFNIPTQNLSFTDGGFYLMNTGQSDLSLPVITADLSSPLNTNKFNIINKSGSHLQYKLFGFTSDADLQKSFLYKDSVIFNTTLHTNLEGVTPSDLKLNIGNISLTTNKIKPLVNNTTPISLSLDNWTLQINKWSLDGVLSATSGTLKTGLVDIPLNGLQLKPDELTNFDLDLKSMSLGGVAQLNVVGNVMFGYENIGNKKWFLTVGKGNNNYAASLSGLPGMEINESIYIASFSLYSDGTKTFSPQYKNIKIYKVGILSLDQMIVGNNSIEMSSLSFDIPKLGQLGSIIQYYKENNKVKLKLVPVPIIINTNGVELALGTDASTQPQILDDNGLRVRGIISEEDKFSFNAWLYHTKDSTSIWLENPNLTTPPNSPPKNWQQLVIGGPQTYLEKIIGNMKVVSGSWQNFWFSGNLIVPSGIEQNKNKLTFTVYGDIVANNQELGVKNINSPFGKISFTYEPENKRFFGSLSIEKDLGYAYMKGQAEAVVDNEGWYFFAGGDLNVYNPNSTGSAGLLIGHHSITDQMKNAFKQYSYVYKHKGSLPMTFPSSLKGFYMEGMTSIPIQSIIGLPDIDIDLVVVSARLWVNAGADMRLSMQFDKGLTIGAGMDNLFDAGFSVSQWFVVECSSLSFSALLDIGSEGQVSTNGDWAAELTGDITLTGKAKVGWGVCDSDCEGKLCDEDSWSGSKMFGIKGHVGSDDKYIKFYSK